MARSMALLASVLLALSAQSGKTESSNLDGTWAGRGAILFSSGAQERAQCRVEYSKSSGTSYIANAVCATPSAKAAQIVRIRETAPNKFEGTFHNAEYAVSGTVHVVVRGRSQTVTLRSDAGSATFVLNR